MRKILLLLLIVLPLYLLISLYFLDRSNFLCPIEYKGQVIIRSDARGEGFFASRRNGNRKHEGVDFFAEIGTPVLAARFGKVIAATKSNGMGNYVTIRHPGNIITIYGHLLEIYVTQNKFVRQGQVIGSVGKTGNARYTDIQPHLHFEVKNNGVPEDPMQYLE